MSRTKLSHAYLIQSISGKWMLMNSAARARLIPRSNWQFASPTLFSADLRQM